MVLLVVGREVVRKADVVGHRWFGHLLEWSQRVRIFTVARHENGRKNCKSKRLVNIMIKLSNVSRCSCLTSLAKATSYLDSPHVYSGRGLCRLLFAWQRRDNRRCQAASVRGDFAGLASATLGSR